MSRSMRSLADREALLALSLAGLGFLSLGATLPAAGVLAVRSIRGERPSDGTGPALGALVLGVAWLSFLLGYPTLRSMTVAALEHRDARTVVAFVAGWLALAVATFLLATFLVRCHPERWLARLLARAGIVTVIAAGCLQLVATTSVRLADPLRRCGDSLDACLGGSPWAPSWGMPWAVLVPAVGVGLAWIGASLVVIAAGKRFSALALRRRWTRRLTG